METGITPIQSERAPSCLSQSYLGDTRDVVFPPMHCRWPPRCAVCRQDGCRTEVRQIFPCAHSAVTFSSVPPHLLIPHPVASHHRHPPCAPRSTRPGCSHGNSRIRSGPVSAVSVSPVSLLGLFFFCSLRPSQRGFWLLTILALRRLFFSAFLFHST